MVADRHRLTAYHNNHCWRAFRGYQHQWPWTAVNPQNRGFKWFFCYFRLRRTLTSEFSLKYTGDRPRQPVYEIKLMLWRVSWALAQISCNGNVMVREGVGLIIGRLWVWLPVGSLSSDYCLDWWLSADWQTIFVYNQPSMSTQPSIPPQ